MINNTKKHRKNKKYTKKHRKNKRYTKKHRKKYYGGDVVKDNIYKINENDINEFIQNMSKTLIAISGITIDKINPIMVTIQEELRNKSFTIQIKKKIKEINDYYNNLPLILNLINTTPLGDKLGQQLLEATKIILKPSIDDITPIMKKLILDQKITASKLIIALSSMFPPLALANDASLAIKSAIDTRKRLNESIKEFHKNADTLKARKVINELSETKKVIDKEIKESTAIQPPTLATKRP